MPRYEEEDYLQLSGIQHFEFCRRQWALIHIEQQWADRQRVHAQLIRAYPQQGQYQYALCSH